MFRALVNMQIPMPGISTSKKVQKIISNALTRLHYPKLKQVIAFPVGATQEQISKVEFSGNNGSKTRLKTSWYTLVKSLLWTTRIC